MIRLERDILAANNEVARRNRSRFAAEGVLALNLMSSPGAGKTTLLVETIAARPAPIAVIEGDQQTSLDAERIRSAGAPAYQVNTGHACHLDAAMVEHAASHLSLPHGGILFIENVGNLVCPAAFDLGEAERVVLVSVTEGDDKPLKYPDIFHAASLVVITKIDLLPHVRFDPDACLERARRLNPAVETLMLSATTGKGLDRWLAWLAGARQGLPASANAGS